MLGVQIGIVIIVSGIIIPLFINWLYDKFRR